MKYIKGQFDSSYKARKYLINKYPDLVIEENVQFKGPLDNLVLGKSCIFQRNSVVHLGGMQWCNNKGKLEIGNNAVISPNVVIYAAGAEVKIGNDFDCGPGVIISASKTSIENSQAHDFKSIFIGDNVTLYSNVVISPGAKIGNHCVVGANSVVNSKISDHSLAIGNPAVVVKENIRK
ncbi:acyltransferase [Portibacter lacus]|uniref:acyltransferase n=1 Tax=Portibacter lacus TaxID=1099794 RepID=UPI001F3F792C|nr:acyltransferase [Portibacter lacus]